MQAAFYTWERQTRNLDLKEAARERERYELAQVQLTKADENMPPKKAALQHTKVIKPVTRFVMMLRVYVSKEATHEVWKSHGRKPSVTR